MENKSIKSPQEKPMNAYDKCQEVTIPLVAFASFRFGMLSKKRKLEVKKDCPEGHECLIEFIKKGMELVHSKNCGECKMVNDLDADFCKKCGMRLEKCHKIN